MGFTFVKKESLCEDPEIFVGFTFVEKGEPVWGSLKPSVWFTFVEKRRACVWGSLKPSVWFTFVERESLIQMTVPHTVSF